MSRGHQDAVADGGEGLRWRVVIALLSFTAMLSLALGVWLGYSVSPSPTVVRDPAPTCEDAISQAAQRGYRPSLTEVAGGWAVTIERVKHSKLGEPWDDRNLTSRATGRTPQQAAARALEAMK